MKLINHDRLTTAMILFLGVCWGTAFIPMKLLSGHVSPLNVAFMRLLVGSIILLPMLWVARPTFVLDMKHLLRNAAVAFFGLSVPFTLIAAGIGQISSSTAAILMGLMPIGTVFFSLMLIPHERPNRYQAFGLCLACAGVVLLSGAEGLFTSSTLGILLIVIATLCYALTNVIARIWGGSRSTHPSIVLICSWIFLLPIYLWFEPFWLQLQSVEQLLLSVYLGAIPTGLATLIYLWLIAQTTALRVSNSTYTVQLTGAILGITLLDESLSLIQSAGIIAMILGVYWMLKKYPPPVLGALRKSIGP